MLNGSSDRKHRIKIYTPVKAPDNYGGLSTSYTLYGERWAAVAPPSFKEQIAQGAPVSRNDITVEIAPDTAIKRGWRLEWQGCMYDITSNDNTYRDRSLIAAERLEVGV